ncbi:hypothetical protein SAY87_017091 [Trapa incisa]|uniref:RING-type E3 ubiquitin transferase n=1 Tax=Trapa incisa TaxID=236973 RepID=A0AAN7LH46_9MYRT|nr:hypothetical protein SAY87_017091 [Trapa incisa]
MELSTKGSIEGLGECVEMGEEGRQAMKWAVENLLDRNPSCALVHFRTQSAHLDGSDLSSVEAIDRQNPNLAPESDIAKSPSARFSSEAGDFSVPINFLSIDRSSAASPALEHSLASISSKAMINVDDELAKLHLQLEESLSVYHRACRDAAAAEQKALGLQRMKTSKIRSSEEDRPRRMKKDSWSTLTGIGKIKKKDTLVVKETASRFSEPASSKEAAEERDQKKQVVCSSTLSRISACYRKYTTEQIEEATEYFCSSRKIGEGSYGSVYKATLDHTSVAIKVMRPDVSQGFRQFIQEVEVLSSMRHQDMVILVGACPEYGCLVYEYLDNGSLEDRLFCKDGTPPVPWRSRLRIAADIATGLVFLHQAKPEPVVHRDIKPSNILLDRNYTGKIGDVGLARMVPVSVAERMAATVTAGTFCYIDPEYQQRGVLGVESDVYSFGLVLLQIITARPPMGLARQVEDAIDSGSFTAVLDRRVSDWPPVEEMLSLARLALKCCEIRRKDRPDLAADVLPELIRLRDLRQDVGSPEPEVTKIGLPPSQIGNERKRCHQLFKSIAGGWNLKCSFKREKIFPVTNRRQQPQKQEQIVGGCWSFMSCSKQAPDEDLQMALVVVAEASPDSISSLHPEVLFEAYDGSWNVPFHLYSG